MKARFIYDGKAIDYTPAENVAAGDVVIIDNLVGVAHLDIPANTLGALHLQGIYDVEKAAGSIAAGAKVFWIVADKKATATEGANKFLGIAVTAAAANDATVRVKIGTSIYTTIINNAD